MSLGGAFRAVSDSLAGLPRAGWVCALAALLVAIAWSLITPLFQVPDEEAHVAYAQYVAETGRLPSEGPAVPGKSEEEFDLLRALRWRDVIHRSDNRPPVTAAAHRKLERAVESDASSVSEGGGTTATTYPPLYYAAAAAAYRASPHTDLPDRVHAMRLLSALLAAITVLLIFLFLRELLPTTPWVWPVGALAVAFQPMFGFISSGVNNDNLLYTSAAAVLLGFAVCFKRGLTVRRGAWIGGATAVGVLGKVSMLGFLPGIALGMLFLVIHASPERRRTALRGALAAAVTLAVPVLAYLALNLTVWDRALYLGHGTDKTIATAKLGPSGQGGSLAGFLTYTWQFYLPRLSFMHDWFEHYQLRQVWFNGAVGRFGWLDYGFTARVYDLALVLAAGMLALAGRELVRCRRYLRDRLAELATYAALAIGLILFVHVGSYIGQLDVPGGFEQARYLFPLLGLYAAVIALAVRGAGERYGPAVGVLVVCITIAHSAVAMLLTLTRYYG
jgi:hypothetical protein